jgi:putative DNA primase/helicase
LSKTTFAAGVEKFAKSDPTFAVTIEAWDRDPWLLGTPGGTVDLRTGILRAADPAEGITKITTVSPASSITCPRWLSFLDEATGRDVDLIRFLRQWAGYCLTGITCEHALVFLHGDGGNGKGTFVNTIAGILGEYAVTATMETFTASLHPRHLTELAMLHGARLVTASETEQGRAWAESRIKQLTGGDPVSANFMRQDHFTFTPAFKLTFLGNHQPVLHNVDAAARRRVNMVPFTRKPAVVDQQLDEKLRAERPGILRWMIKGCLEWQPTGLVRPPIVLQATEEYFAERDVFKQWFDEEIELHPGNQYCVETSADLFESWQRFAKDAGTERPPSVKAFSKEMKRFGLKPKPTKTGRVYLGVKLHRPLHSYADEEVR